ncbi:hypothetical protein V7200_23020 [Cytobacillus firmus]|uniref:Uncharacterized protein n=1 Tax=Cytobacillus firmus TaxID=1399 RepID=A0A800N8G2_CYTFI|nr:hypothetical protein [Cytobacillus firmus]KAF0821514.1 hypothetical protein KIS1582_4757 [Cytobacillus firmus]
MAQNYLVSSWQSLLKILVNLCGKGYFYYHLTELPVNKKKKWEEIDAKFIKKYQSDKNKWQRQRQKRKGVANFYYLRWEHIVLVLHTEGEVPKEIIYDDKVSDVRQSPIFIKISELSAFRIQFIKDRVTVFLDSDTYKGLKDSLYNVAKTKSKFKMKQAFNLINGYPAYKGILEQKNHLAEYLVSQAKKHGVTFKRNELRFNTKLEPRKIYNDSV